MSEQEFVQWLRGMTDALDGQPSEKQWAKILQNLARVPGAALEAPPVSGSKLGDRPKTPRLPHFSIGPSVQGAK
jgi:hypothetical protein